MADRSTPRTKQTGTDREDWVGANPDSNESTKHRFAGTSAFDILFGMEPDRGKGTEAQYAAWMQAMFQYFDNREAREYNSVGEQVKRLMEAGMSRTQAMLTATAGEAQPTAMPDMASAVGIDKQNRLGAWQTGLKAAGSTMQFLAGNYGTIFDMAGDMMVQPIGEEIYSWLPKGIQVPDIARADAQHFKQWCLGQLKDNNGNPLEPPQEARDLIASKAWRRMAAHPAGWLAFEKYFNANYSTRGYHEDYEDAQNMRRLARMELVQKRFDAMLSEPAVVEASVYMMMQDLNGLSLHEANGAGWQTMLIGDDQFQMEGMNDFGIAIVNGQFQFSDDAPMLVQGVFDEFNERMQTAAYMSSPRGCLDALEDLRKDRKMNLFAKYVDNIIKMYEKNNLQFEAEHQAEGQSLYNKYVPDWLQHLREFRNAWNKLGNPSSSSSSSSSSGNGAEVVESVGDKVVKSQAIKGAVKLGAQLITKIP